MADTYTITFRTQVTIEAESISEALETFQKKHPEPIQSISMNGQQLPHVYSRGNRRPIYYRSGCPYGNTDCILDPMGAVACYCRSQEEMTPDKWVPCPDADDENGTCWRYDNECK